MNDFFYGVIEGFYGRQWTWSAREDFAGFLAQHGFDCYIYAPKGDTLLRSRWRDFHSDDCITHLTRLRQQYHHVGMRWGLGLSPLGLSEHYSPEDALQLQYKVKALNALKPDILCILFDDSRGDIADLAATQLAIVKDILSVSYAKQHIVCPTYYSFDPVLEDVFGKMPDRYLQALGAGLDQNVGMFWTGNNVVAEQFTEHDIRRVSTLIRRRPILWDNYPVNDGRITSKHLHLRAYTGRPYQLRDWCAGHIVNPMNQPHLSRLVLPSLQQVYQLKKEYREQAALESALKTLSSKGLADTLKQHQVLFQQHGLDAIPQSTKENYQQLYRSFNDPLADEVAQWLAGGYQFDPQCLTD